MSLILDWSYKCCGWKTVFHSFDNTEDPSEDIEMNTVPNDEETEDLLSEDASNKSMVHPTFNTSDNIEEGKI